MIPSPSVNRNFTARTPSSNPSFFLFIILFNNYFSILFLYNFRRTGGMGLSSSRLTGTPSSKRGGGGGGGGGDDSSSVQDESLDGEDSGNWRVNY